MIRKIILQSLIICFCLWLGVSSSSQLVLAQSSGLENLSDTIGTNTLNFPDVIHVISFILPASAQLLTPTDWIHIDLYSFSDVTVPNFVGGEYAGTPSFSVSGTVGKVTGITVLPGDGINIQGMTATNPPTQDFRFQVKITSDEAGNLIKNIGNGSAAIFVGSIQVSAQVTNPSARLMISGFTAPQTFVILTEGSSTIGTEYAGFAGYFGKLLTGIVADTHYVSVHGIDEASRTTSIIDLEVYTPNYQTTTISNLLLSPTLEISDTTVLLGQDLYATGSAYPNSNITLFTDSPVRSYTATASATGDWTATISNTSNYSVGDYRIYSIAQTNIGLQSLFSPSQLFTIQSEVEGGGTACGDISHGDLNCDSSINLTDFSILMYYWSTTNAAADINSDLAVNLTDFSIMMYYWAT